LKAGYGVVGFARTQGVKRRVFLSAEELSQVGGVLLEIAHQLSKAASCYR
jgi:hypothetical protein